MIIVIIAIIVIVRIIVIIIVITIEVTVWVWQTGITVVLYLTNCCRRVKNQTIEKHDNIKTIKHINNTELEHV